MVRYGILLVKINYQAEASCSCFQSLCQAKVSWHSIQASNDSSFKNIVCFLPFSISQFWIYFLRSFLRLSSKAHEKPCLSSAIVTCLLQVILGAVSRWNYFLPRWAVPKHSQRKRRMLTSLVRHQLELWGSSLLIVTGCTLSLWRRESSSSLKLLTTRTLD